MPITPGLITLVHLSISERDAVVARLRAADQHAALMVDPDRLAAAQWHHSHIDVVAAMPQIFNDRLGYGALDPNLVAKGENPGGFDGFTLRWAVIAYAAQIYCDFSGYSDLAVGCAKWFGFELPQNFHFPYLSANIAEFWKRWHISLSTWMRDYLYIPLGGSRAGTLRTYFNLIVTLTL